MTGSLEGLLFVLLVGLLLARLRLLTLFFPRQLPSHLPPPLIDCSQNPLSIRSRNSCSRQGVGFPCPSGACFQTCSAAITETKKLSSCCHASHHEWDYLLSYAWTLTRPRCLTCWLVWSHLADPEASLHFPSNLWASWSTLETAATILTD